MSTDAVSPLRQRMIEDMNARKLGAHSQKSHIDSCKRFAAFSSAHRRRRQRMISAASSYTWPGAGSASAIATAS